MRNLGAVMTSAFAIGEASLREDVLRNSSDFGGKLRAEFLGQKNQIAASLTSDETRIRESFSEQKNELLAKVRLEADNVINRFISEINSIFAQLIGTNVDILTRSVGLGLDSSVNKYNTDANNLTQKYLSHNMAAVQSVGDSASLYEKFLSNYGALVSDFTKMKNDLLTQGNLTKWNIVADTVGKNNQIEANKVITREGIKSDFVKTNTQFIPMAISFYIQALDYYYNLKKTEIVARTEFFEARKDLHVSYATWQWDLYQYACNMLSAHAGGVMSPGTNIRPTRTQSTVGGVISGAATGAQIGSGVNTGYGTAIGAVVGAVVGGAAGYLSN